MVNFTAGMGMSEPELSPFQELSLLEGVYFSGVVKTLLLYQTVAITSSQIGALSAPNSPLFLSTTLVDIHLLIQSVNYLLDARYHTATEILIKPSPCCQMAYCFVGGTPYLYTSPEGHFCIVCSTNVESKMEADANGELRLNISSGKVSFLV